MNRSGKFHALLSTSRIANVPSVVVNVWLGVAVAGVSGGWQTVAHPWPAAGRLALAGVLLYLAGNFLNDWMDRDWDRDHRPERALPRGLFSPRLYLGVAATCAIAGWSLAATAGPQPAMAAAAILVAVVSYTIWHKRSPLAVIAMSLCRALLPVMGALAFSGIPENPGSSLALQLPGGQLFQVEAHSFFLFPHSSALVACAAGLFCHIAGLSLSARHESMSDPPRWISQTSRALFLATLGMMALAAYNCTGRIDHSAAGMIPYAMWVLLCISLWRKPVSTHVSRLLAGIPLADWMVLLPIALALSLSPAAGGGVEPFSLVCLILPPLAFGLALGLQRLAPAT